MEQVEVGSPVHLPLEHFDPVPMPFDRPGVVFESQPGGDGIGEAMNPPERLADPAAGTSQQDRDATNRTWIADSR